MPVLHATSKIGLAASTLAIGIDLLQRKIAVCLWICENWEQQHSVNLPSFLTLVWFSCCCNLFPFNVISKKNLVVGNHN